MKYFPVFLDLRRKRILVIGGGPVAAQKIRDLKGSGAKVTVIAKKALPGIKHLKRSFRPSDLEDQDLVFCATEDSAFNHRLSALCRERHLWVNVADKPKHCSFILPAVFRRGEIVAAFSTGGGSPAMAKFLRKKLEENIGPETGRLFDILKSIRGQLTQIDLKGRRKILQKILSEESLSQIRRGDISLVRKNLKDLLKGT